MERSILFTGGGSAGHVTANLALMPEFAKLGWDILYIGSASGIEASLVKKLPFVKYVPISTGKLRRYFSWKNFSDPFRVIFGVWQAWVAVRKYKPAVVFSRGGFVSVPVVIAAWLNKVPIVMHESNITPGLANRITAPFAAKICMAFEETSAYMRKKAVYVGPIIRQELSKGDPERAIKLCDFSNEKPVILVMGGSLGSRTLNEIVRRNIRPLLKDYQVAHICGKGGVDSLIRIAGYRQFEYVYDELADLLAMAGFVISRAGANSICEYLSLYKPMLLIPLSLRASRGDQLLNAESFRKKGYAEVLMEEDLTDSRFLTCIGQMAVSRLKMRDNMMRDYQHNSLARLVGLIESTAKSGVTHHAAERSTSNL